MCCFKEKNNNSLYVGKRILLRFWFKDHLYNWQLVIFGTLKYIKCSKVHILTLILQAKVPFTNLYLKLCLAETNLAYFILIYIVTVTQQHFL